MTSDYTNIFFDVDGTLLRNNASVLSSAVRNFLIEMAKSINVSVCTARSYQQIREIFLDVPLGGYSAFMNGALIMCHSSGEIIEEHFLYFDELFNIKNILLKFNKSLYIIRDGVFKEYLNERKSSHSAIILNLTSYEWDNIKSKIEIKLPYLSLKKGISLNGSGYDIIVTHQAASKESAIKKIASLRETTTKSFVGVGDGYTDINFLSLCGLTFAMSNGVNEIKNIANYILPRVEENGVIEIKKYLKLRDCISLNADI